MSNEPKAHIGLWITQGPKEPQSAFKFWTPVYKHHTGQALADLWRIQFWAQAQSATGSVPSGQIPEAFNRIRLYHVRKERCVIVDQTVQEQGISAGDVLVLFESTEDCLEMNLSLLLAQYWPMRIPVELALTRDSITLDEIPSVSETGTMFDAVEAKVGFGGVKLDIKKLWSLIRSRLASR